MSFFTLNEYFFSFFFFKPEIALLAIIMYFTIRCLVFEKKVYNFWVVSWFINIICFILFIFICWYFYSIFIQLNTNSYYFFTGFYRFLLNDMFKIFICFFSILSFIFLKNEIKNLNYNGVKFELILFFLLNIFGCLFLLNSGNLLVQYLVLELQALSLCILVCTPYIQDVKNFLSIESSLKFFILNALNSSILLIGISLIFKSSGTLNLFDINNLYFYESVDLTNNFEFVLGVLMFFSSFLFKLGLFPFHNWSIDVLHVSSTSISFFILSVIKISYVGFLIPLILGPFNSLHNYFHYIFFIFGFLSIFFGLFSSINQVYIKRLIAYLMVVSSGYVSIGLSAVNFISYQNILVYFFVGLLMVSVIYSLLIAFKKIDNEGEITHIYEFNFLSSNKNLSLILSISLLSLAGVPFFSGFVVKYFFYKSLFLIYYNYVVVLLLLLNMVYIYIVLKNINIMYFNSFLNMFNNYVISKFILLYVILIFWFNIFYLLNTSIVMYFFEFFLINLY